MFSIASDSKLHLDLDDEENMNYSYNVEHREALEKLFKYASSLASMVPRVAMDIAEAEKMYEISFSAMLKTGKPPAELANEVILQLQQTGRLPVLRNAQRFVYPKIEDYADDMLTAPVVKREAISPTLSKASSPVSAISAATMSFVDPLSGPADSPSSSEQELADIEKRKKEQMAKQAKALADKENEALQRKMIREQFEKDRAERLRQEEERRIQRSAETQQGSPTASNPLSTASSLQVPSSGQTASSSSPLSSPRQQSHQQSKPQPEPVVERQGHWAAPSSTPRQAERPRNIDPEEMLRYVELLAKLESELKRTNNFLQATEKLREIHAVTEFDDKVAQWKNYAVALKHDIEMVSKIIRGDITGPEQNYDTPAHAGFTLRGEDIGEMDFEEVSIEPRALILVPSAPKWRVKVHLLNGPQVVVGLNPAHTIQDILQHLASLSPFTNRYHLEIVGKPGELDPLSTAEASGLNMTTLRLIRK